MDSYLEIARKVLNKSRQPLSAREMLSAAYKLQIVPRDLYGRTQHKTLQARLSTDILKHRAKSAFYRNEPGRFFLRSMLDDSTIPAQYRREYLAPARAVQLGRFKILCFSRSDIKSLLKHGPLEARHLVQLPYRYYWMNDLRTETELVPLRFLVVLLDAGRVLLSHRRPSNLGDLDGGLSIGFPGIVREEDKSLFSSDEIGLLDGVLRTLIESLDLPGSAIGEIEHAWHSARQTIIIEEQFVEPQGDLLAVISLCCTGISAVADAVGRNASLEWLPVPLRVNDLDRFDRWSTCIIISDASLFQGSLLADEP